MNSEETQKVKNSSAQTVNFERGFKAWSENIAQSLRKKLNISKFSPLSPYELASYLNVRIISPKDIDNLSKETCKYLTSSEGNEWSAITLNVSNISVIIINTFHSQARQASDIMHELAHILRGHKTPQVFIDGSGLTIRSFDQLQEAEADWLAGTLLLPREVLIHCHFNKLSEQEACRLFNVSSELYKYRMNISGVKRQFVK